MRLRHKLALKYFFGALACFVVGYAAAWISTFGTHHPLQASQPMTVASVSPSDNAAKADQGDKNKPSPKAGAKYSVKSGDTLSSVASQFGISFEQLAQYNNIPYPYNLTIGQTLTIPGK